MEVSDVKITSIIKEIFKILGERLSSNKTFGYLEYLKVHGLMLDLKSKIRNIKEGKDVVQLMSKTLSRVLFEWHWMRHIRMHELSTPDFLRSYRNNLELVTKNSKLMDRMAPLKTLRNIFNIDFYSVSLLCWKKSMFNPLFEKVTSSILQMIKRDRDGETIDGSTIKTVINSYVDMGVVADRSQIQSLSVYVKTFEDKLLEETQYYYAIESNSFLEDHSALDYMRKVEARLKEENLRVQKFLHSSSLPKLNRICEQTLILPHLEKFYPHFDNLLLNESVEDLVRLFDFVNRLGPEHVQELCGKFQTHVGQNGRSGLAAEPRAIQDPIAYFNKLYEVYGKYNRLLTDAFQSDVNFQSGLDKAFTEFVNSNHVSQISPNKPASLLAKYADLMMKQKVNGIGDDEMESAMTNLMTIFRYLKSKDVFQQYYTVFLSNRLTTGSSGQRGFEEAFLAKLKLCCGQEYVGRMERMFRDVDSSKELSTRFKTEGKDSDENPITFPFVFSILVLTSGSWDFTEIEQMDFPREFVSVQSSFTTFYTKEHTGRTLTWLGNRSHGEMHYYSASSRRYTLVVSMYQMTILLMFNDQDTVNVATMMTATKLSFEFVSQVLEPLLTNKFLVNALPDEPLKPDSDLKLFLEYKYNRLKVNFNKPLREIKQEEEQMDKDVIFHRQLVIKATIVRIMKTRKILDLSSLTVEIMDQIKNQFPPDVRMIKTVIEQLIVEEYIKRSENDAKVFEYMA